MHDRKYLFKYPRPSEVTGPAKLEMDAWAKLEQQNCGRGGTHDAASP